MTSSRNPFCFVIYLSISCMFYSNFLIISLLDTIENCMTFSNVKDVDCKYKKLFYWREFLI